VSCLNAHRIAEQRSRQYATSEDFRELFTEDSRGLYLLSILLTVDHEKAERCFIASLDECINGNSVFHEWAHSWARRMIVQNAVRMLTLNSDHTRPATAASPSADEADLSATVLQDPFLARVLALENLERFVYVLSVLEKYSDQNCAVLLGVSPQRVRETRICALEHIGHFDCGYFLPADDLACVGAV
jgi:hypothetical protein